MTTPADIPEDDPDPLGLIGRKFDGRYTVGEKIGEGGMAHVYLARDETTGEQVAVKILQPTLTQDVIAMKRLNREAERGARLVHPNLCNIIRRGRIGDLVYLVMPYLQGELLAIRTFRDGQVPLAQAVRIVRDLSAGLHAAHELGIIHRDLKPENVMLVPNVDGSERAVLMDFGLATEPDEVAGRTKLTVTGLVVGTPEFMSPEQMRGDDLDRRSDVYSLAFMTCELLTGQLPFSGTTVRQMAIARMKGELISIRTQRPDLNFPVALERVLAKALAVKPEDRYQTTVEFGAAFAHASGTESAAGLLGWLRRS